jgi:anti-sigma B factor antagonist
VVRASGDFDLLAVEPFAAELDHAATLAAAAGTTVVIDLRGLAFIDSSGLRAILDGHSRLAARDVGVSLLKPPARLWRVFTVTGADRLLPFDDLRAVEVGPPRELES